MRRAYWLGVLVLVLALASCADWLAQWLPDDLVGPDGLSVAIITSMTLTDPLARFTRRRPRAPRPPESGGSAGTDDRSQ